MASVEGDSPHVVHEIGDLSDEVPERPQKTPKRILHFSDGILEEYSSDEDEADKAKTTRAVDTKRMHWPQYMLYILTLAGNRTLKACDYMGEGLANFFGITTPKYQYEINEYERMIKEQEELAKKEDIEMRGWTKQEDASGTPPVVNIEPLSSGDSPAVVVQERY